MTRLMNLRPGLIVTVSLALLGCQTRPHSPADPRTCEQKRTQLVDVLNKLPSAGLAAAIDVGLPSSTLSGSFGKGTILEVSAAQVTLNGVTLAGDTLERRAVALEERASDIDRNLPLYIAAEWQTDVATLHAYLMALPKELELKVLFTAPPIPASESDEPLLDPSHHGHALAAKVLAERDAAKRLDLVTQGYEDYSSCPAVSQAAVSVEGALPRDRWPRLREAMVSAIPKCQCSDIDADGLRHLLVAEQRAGSVGLGSIPIAFLRDQRCTAAMPLASVQEVLDEIDEFDAEFAGDWKDDALVFDKVVTNERLLNYMCIALPDETLAWLQRKGSMIYWRPPTGACQAWRFEQLARGAPMGTWRRVAEGSPSLAIHYRQGANEIRLFGPITSPQSNPTDPGPWGCNEDFRMIEGDGQSILLEGGPRWYFDEQSCNSAPATEGRMAGCIANLAVGIAPPPKSTAAAASEGGADAATDGAASAPAPVAP
jgi:hypothetical protein